MRYVVIASNKSAKEVAEILAAAGVEASVTGSVFTPRHHMRASASGYLAGSENWPWSYKVEEPPPAPTGFTVRELGR